MMPKTFDKSSKKNDKDSIYNLNNNTENKKYDKLPKINSRVRKPERPKYQTLNEFYAMRETQNFLLIKIGDIRKKPPIVHLNEDFIENKANLYNWKENNKLLQERAMSVENMIYKKRLNETKSAFLQLYDKKFLQSYEKMVNEEREKAKKMIVKTENNKKKSPPKRKNVAIKINISDSDFSYLEQQSHGGTHRRPNDNYDNNINNKENNSNSSSKDKNNNNEDSNNENNKSNYIDKYKDIKSGNVKENNNDSKDKNNKIKDGNVKKINNGNKGKNNKIKNANVKMNNRNNKNKKNKKNKGGYVKMNNSADNSNEIIEGNNFVNERELDEQF